MLGVKGKGSPYSITEHRVPGLIPVLGSQSAGDVSHKPGDRFGIMLDVGLFSFLQSGARPKKHIGHESMNAKMVLSGRSDLGP